MASKRLSGSPPAAPLIGEPTPDTLLGNTLPRILKRYLGSVRPMFLTASVLPVLVGSSWGWQASGTFHPLVLAIALTVVVLVHAGANVANDVADDRTGTGPPERTACTPLHRRLAFHSERGHDTQGDDFLGYGSARRWNWLWARSGGAEGTLGARLRSRRNWHRTCLLASTADAERSRGWAKLPWPPASACSQSSVAFGCKQVQ